MGIRANDRVLAYGRFITQIDRLRILKGDTSVHPLTAELFLVRCFHTGKLLSRIHPFDFVKVRSENSTGRQPGPDCRSNDVGQIVFALRIGWLETIKCGEEKVRPDTVYAGVDFLDAEFLGRGVTRLNNADDLPVGPAHNTAVLSRVGALRGQDREGRLMLLMRRDKLSERLWREERHVAGDNQNITPKACELLFGRAYRVARATLLLLEGEAYPLSSTRGLSRGLNRSRLMANHNNQAAGMQTLAGAENMRQERFAG